MTYVMAITLVCVCSRWPQGSVQNAVSSNTDHFATVQQIVSTTRLA